MLFKFKDLVAKQQHTNWVKLRVHQNQRTNYGKSGEKLQVLNRNNKVAISCSGIKGEWEREKREGKRGKVSNQI